MDAGSEKLDDRREKLLSDILQLAVACPHDNCNPTCCPLHEVRKLTPEERSKWFRMLSAQDLEYLRDYHQICLQCRSTEG
mgnify:CR=1 FL=1